MKTIRHFIVFTVLALMAMNINAQVLSPLAAEQLINTDIPSAQQQAQIASDENGNYVSVWWLGAQGDVIARRYNSSHVAVGGEIVITTDNSSKVNIEYWEDEKYIVTYWRNGDLFFRILYANNSISAAYLIKADAEVNYDLDIKGDSVAFTYIIVPASAAVKRNVYLRGYNLATTSWIAPEIQVSVQGMYTSVRYPKVVYHPTGRLTVVYNGRHQWGAVSTDSDQRILRRTFTPAFLVETGEQIVLSGDNDEVVMYGMDAEGNDASEVIIFMGHGNLLTSFRNIRMWMLDELGSYIVQDDTLLYDIPWPGSMNERANVQLYNNGDFVIAAGITLVNGGDYTESKILYGVNYNSQNSGWLVCNTYHPNSQTWSDVAKLPNGGFVTCWEGDGVPDGLGVYLRAYSAVEFPGVGTNVSGNIVVDETGSTQVVDFTLNTQPTGNVTVNLSSSDLGEGTLSASQLIFTNADWNIVQQVTVTGIDDPIDDGDINFDIDVDYIGSVDATYLALPASTISVVNLDDEATMTPIANQSVCKSNGLTILNYIVTNVGGSITGITGTSSNQSIVDDADITITNVNPTTWDIAISNLGNNVAGTCTITITATDGIFNYTETFDITTIQDLTNPTITCPGNQVGVVNGSCVFVLPDYTGLAVVADNCTASPTVTQSPLPGTSVGTGTTVVTFTVTDGSSNTANCNFNVVVSDINPPTAVCQNINLYLDGAGNGTIVAADVDGGSTDNCGTVLLSASTTAFTCANLGPNNVTLTVDDGNGNSSNCIGVVTVIDTISPVTTCPGNQIENPDAACNFTLPDYTALVTASDNCNPAPTVTQSPVAGTVISGTTTITMTSNDGNGNTSSCTFDVTLNDATAPTAVCQNINVYLDGAGNASIVAADLDGGSTDNCSGLTLAASQTAFTCADLGPVNVTLTVTDGNANSSNCNSVVTVIDTISPSAVCQNINVYLDGAGNGNIVAADIDGGSTDNCGAVSLSASTTAFTCADLGPNNVTLTIDDGNGNTGNCIAVVTVIDTISPVTTCQNINVYLNGAGNASIIAADINAGSFDNCGVVTLSASQTAFTCAVLGPNNVTLTVDDGNGNTGNCVAVVTVIDTISPSAVCQNINAYLDGAGNVSIVAADVDGGSTDNCGVVTLTASTTAFTCADLGSNNVTFTADDGNGNTANCVAVVTVIDTISPVTTCPGNQIENPDAACNFTLPDYTALVTATDNCNPASTVTQSPAPGTVISGTTTIIMTSNDGNGNTSTCTFDVGLDDATAPTAICQNINVYLDGAGNASIVPNDLDGGSTDNCSGVTTSASQTVFTCADLGPNNVTLTVTDGNSNSANCIAVVTVIDTISPITLALADVTAECSSTAIAPTTTDNCTGIVTGTTTDPLTYNTQGTFVINWTFDDGNGNSIVVSQNVVIDDVTDPTPDLGLLPNVLAECSVPSLIAAMATDNCVGVVTVTHDATLPITTQGTTIVTWTFDDGNGNTTTQTQNVIVDDITNPTMPVLADVTGECSATATVPSTTDNCSGTVTGTTTDPLTYNTQGTFVINWTFDDGNGNSIVVPQNVIIDDVINPIAPVLADITAECSATATAPVTIDNCAGTITGTTTDPLTYNAQGTFVINWTFDDGNGNSIVVPQNVIINDVSDPIPDLGSLPGVLAECSVSSLIAPTATDNCGGVVTVTHDATLPINTQATTVVTWTFDDGNGNTTTQTQNVIVDDITNPDTPVLNDSVGECTATVTAPSTTDNCSGTITGTTTDPLTYNTQGTYVINWTFDDGNGNSIVVPQNVIIDDVTSPIVDQASLADITETCEVTTLTPPTATDNCSGAITGTHDATLPISAVGTTVVTWSYDDGNGNITTQTQNVIITGVDVSTTLETDQITITANNVNGTYQWIDCSNGNTLIAGETNQSYTATANGDYAVIVTENGCVDTSACVTISHVGIDDLKFDEFVLYPNPSMTGMFTIQYEGIIRKVDVIDMLGRVISLPVDLDTKIIDGSRLARGKYIVRLYTDANTVLQRQVVVMK